MHPINKFYILFSFTGLSFLTACKQEQNIPNTKVQTTNNSSTIYVTNDNNQEFIILENSDSENGKILVKDSKTNTEYNLHRVKTNNGIKYENEDGYTLWTKADAFTWSKNGENLVKGHLKTTEISDEKVSTSKFNASYFGNYVDQGYDKKDLGADWVSVTITPIDDFKAKIAIRSRGDKKRGTCTFDGVANVSDENTLNLTENNLPIILNFKDNHLSITTEPEFKIDGLTFYCSGGASLANTYTKLSGELDVNQIDKTGYFKSLIYNNILFMIEENRGEVTITPRGIEVSMPETFPINGKITNVEIGDLNNDAFPELLIYTSTGANSKGTVYGYSVNNGKSMSMINVPNISELTDVSTGYNGHDEFAMVEGTFVQRFPMYENDIPTGKTKQIQYKLENGEVMNQMMVDKVVEY